MLPHTIQEFTLPEREYYWEQCDGFNTFCKATVVLHSKDVNDELSLSFSKQRPGKHAEIVVLEEIVDDLKSQKLKIKDDSVVLDVIIRINNSPCSDCQEILFDLLMEIKEMASNSHFRLIIFFSNLYDKTNEGIEEFTEWILELVEKDVIVILCPLFVYTMVPMPYKINTTDKMERANLDQDCIDSFRDLLSEIEEYSGSFSIEISDDLFQKRYKVYKSLFNWEDPHFISIFPRNKPKQLSQLFIVPGFFKSKPIKKEIKERKGRKRQQSSEPAKVSAKDTEMKSSKRAKYSED